MNRAEKAMPWLLALLAVGMLLAWFLVSFKPVKRTVPLPPRGEAGYNPLYALKQALRADGVQAQSRQRLQLDAVALGPRDTVVVYSDPRTLAPADLERLFAFADGGGHLLLRLPPWSGSSAGNGAAALAQYLPIKPLLLPPDCVFLKVDGENLHQEFCRDARFLLDGEPALEGAWSDGRNGYAYARFRHGQGSVDLLGGMEMLANGNLRERTHYLFVRQLLAPNWGQGTVHLVYAADMPPLWRWLLEHGWMALLPAFLGLLAWLWLRAQRVGPLLPSPLPPRRSLREHVDASGEHLLRYGQMTLLHRALRESVLARLRRRDPLAAAQEGAAQAALLAPRTGLDAAHVRATLDTRPPADTADFRHRIARLIDLRKRL